MLKLIHAPFTRSSRILALIEELGIRDKVDIELVDVRRNDGTGQADPANPHPEGKVPLLLDNGVAVSESGAIMVYLTDLFPAANIGPLPGDPLRPAYLTCMFWYGSVLEPVTILDHHGVSHPMVTAAIRGPTEAAARIRAALDRGPWLLGRNYSAADLLCHSPYAFFGAVPDDPLIQDWVARCRARPALARAMQRDQGFMADWRAARAAA